MATSSLSAVVPEVVITYVAYLSPVIGKLFLPVLQNIRTQGKLDTPDSDHARFPENLATARTSSVFAGQLQPPQQIARAQV